MFKKHKILRWLIPVYLVLEIAALVFSKLSARIGYSDAAILFSAIVLNAAFALFAYLAIGRSIAPRRERLIVLALYITVVADLFLTYLGRTFAIPGVICFCAVETVYAAYLKSSRASILLRVYLFMILFCAAIAMNSVSVLNVAALIDIAILSVNVFDAWRPRCDRPNLAFRIGIILFLCCDLCVGLCDLIPGQIGMITGFLIWVFYIPSQVLITLSCVKNVTLE